MHPALFLQFGKREDRLLTAAGVAGLPETSRLFFLSDPSTGFCFLIDTGAEVSVISASRIERQHPPLTLALQAADSTPIPTYGHKSLCLNLGLRRSFRWVFVIADVQFPIIGADFLRDHNLLVDM